MKKVDNIIKETPYRAIPWWELHEDLMKDKKYAKVYKKLHLRSVLAAKVLRYRVDNHLSQKKMAAFLDVPLQRLRRIESMQYDPRLSLLERIASRLGLEDIATLLQDDE